MLKRRKLPHRQRGMTLIEVTLAMALTAIITTVYQAQQIISVADEALAQGIGTQLVVVQGFVTRYQQLKFVELSNGTAVAGVVDPLHPTVAELKALGLVPATVRDTTSSGQEIRISLTRIGCPGIGCTITGLVYPNGALVLPRTGATVRMDLADVVVGAMKGAGGLSYFGNESQVRGASGSYPNPLGAEVGVVGALTYVDTAFYNQFVRINDSRDPNLTGNLTVAGDATVGGALAITGAVSASSTASFSGAVSSQAGFKAGSGGCDRAELAAAGSLAIRNAACQTVATIDSLGRVQLFNAGVARAVMDGSTGSMSLSNGAGSQVVSLSQNAGGGIIEAKNAAGVSTASLNGETGLLTGTRVAVTATGAEGAGCGAGVNEGDFVKDSNAGGTILTCRSGVWVSPGLRRVAIGSACLNDAELGKTASGASAICRSGAWVALGERIGRQVQVARFGVVDGSSVPKPTCGTGTPTLMVTPVDVAIDYSGAPPRNRYFATGDDAGASWSVKLRLMDSSGTVFTHSFGGVAYGLQGIATTFCDYPT